MVLVDESEKFVAALVQEPSLTVVVRDRILWEWEFCHFLESGLGLVRFRSIYA